MPQLTPQPTLGLVKHVDLAANARAFGDKFAPGMSVDERRLHDAALVTLLVEAYESGIAVGQSLAIQS